MDNKAEDVFAKELSNISSDEIRNFTTAVMNVLPSYFLSEEQNGMDNPIVKAEKNSEMIAERLFLLSGNKDKFSSDERDMIRSAILLSDGFLYAGHEPYVETLHPYEMAEYVLEDYWEQYLSLDKRHEIALLIESHHGYDKKNNDAVLFVQSCILLTDTDFYPSLQNGQIYLYNTAGTENINDMIDVAKNIIGDAYWDGVLMSEGMDSYIVLDDTKFYIPQRLQPAFQILGQVRKSNLLKEKKKSKPAS